MKILLNSRLIFPAGLSAFEATYNCYRAYGNFLTILQDYKKYVVLIMCVTHMVGKLDTQIHKCHRKTERIMLKLKMRG